MSRGFWGTAAPWAADFTFTIEIGMGLALILGAVMARKRRFRAHAWCQSAVVLLNLGVLTGYMVPSFRSQVIAALPAGINDSHYLLAAAHGVIGLVAELFALYVVLAAGTNWLPQRLRFVRYRHWMRTALALWWLSVLLGCAVYALWYIVPLYQA